MTNSAIRIEATDGLVLHVHTWGPKPPKLLLVHGFGQGGFVWRSLAASISGYGIAAVDLRGHGDSEHDRLQRYSPSSHAADVVSAARSLDLEDYVLIGHSLGAAVSILAVEQLSRPPRAVILVDGGPGLSQSASAYIREEFLRLKFRYRSIIEYQEYLQALMPLAPTSLLHAIAADALEELGPNEFRQKADRALAYHGHSASLDADLWKALRGMNTSLLLVRGAASALCSKRWSEEFAARVPSATIETVDRAGHAVMLDNPERFNALVQSYVSGWLDSFGSPVRQANCV